MALDYARFHKGLIKCILKGDLGYNNHSVTPLSNSDTKMIVILKYGGIHADHQLENTLRLSNI